MEALLAADKSHSVLADLTTVLIDAYERARADGRAPRPWTDYAQGRLAILVGQGYEALEAYSRGVASSPDAWTIGATLRALDRLAPGARHLEGYDWARTLLVLGLAARAPSTAVRATLRDRSLGPVRGPVVLVAGGTARNVEGTMARFRAVLVDGFAGFDGTVISGGTRQGVSGLAGDVGAAHHRVVVVGYAPASMPDDATRDVVPSRYRDIRATTGTSFSPREPLQGWVDVVASGVAPSSVRLLGIGGGRIARAEYHVALALGAAVAVVPDAGGAGAALLEDEAWRESPNLHRLDADPGAIAGFLA